MKKKKMTWGKLGIAVFAVIAVISTYIMYNRIGQVPGVECGPGQYYYTDIPNWQKYFMVDYYHTDTPMIVFIILFFVWGFLMFKLWSWLDKKIK